MFLCKVIMWMENSENKSSVFSLNVFSSFCQYYDYQLHRHQCFYITFNL